MVKLIKENLFPVWKLYLKNLNKISVILTLIFLIVGTVFYSVFTFFVYFSNLAVKHFKARTRRTRKIFVLLITKISWIIGCIFATGVIIIEIFSFIVVGCPSFLFNLVPFLIYDNLSEKENIEKSVKDNLDTTRNETCLEKEKT